MSAKKPGSEGEPNNIDFALNQIEIDTQKADLMPSREQFKSLTEKVLALRLGEGSARASKWERYCSDLENLFSLLPKASSEVVSKQYFAIRTEKFFRKPVWDKFYEGVLDFFHGQAAKKYPVPEECAFWEACFRKYLEISIKYQDLIQ